MRDLWQFSSSDRLEELTFNKVLERFYDFGIAGLVRENVQNSLDGKLQGSKEPVIVNIEIGTINKNDIPGLDEVKARISCLKGRNSYTKETIKHMQSKMNDECVSYISFEDSNTKGLAGAKNGQTNNPKDTWSIYAYNKGVHGEEEDEALEKSRGGSHGIGKIASNAASDIYMMYFANCDAYGNKHLGGTVQLIEHEFESNYYRSTGYFTSVEQDKEKQNKFKFMPHKNEFNNIFSKDTRGLKIIISFLREQFNDEREIIRSVCDSFFIAILEKKLKVIVNKKIIDDKTIVSYIKNSKYYDQDIDNIKDVFTTLDFDTYINTKPRSLNIKSKEDNYEFNLYFNYDTKIPRGRVGIVRTIGMKIEDKKVKNNVKKPFNAVLIPKTTKEDEFLKSLENESHTELSCDHIKDLKLQKSSKTFINNISTEISKIIEEEIRKNNPTDGKIDTSDIIYELNAELKENILNNISTVKIKKNTNKNNKKSSSKQSGNMQQVEVRGVDQEPVSEQEEMVITITTSLGGEKDIDQADYQPGEGDGGNQTPHKQYEKDPEGDNISEIEGGKDSNSQDLGSITQNENTEINDEDPEVEYNVSTAQVERIVISDKEFIKFNLTTMNQLKRLKVCDIGVAIIDGMGEEHKNKFRMKDNYKSVVDLSTNTKLKIKNNFIKNVTIKDGIANLQIELKDNYNKALKFVYYVGV